MHCHMEFVGGKNNNVTRTIHTNCAFFSNPQIINAVKYEAEIAVQFSPGVSLTSPCQINEFHVQGITWNVSDITLSN